jgi:hypothetical protein
MACYRHPEVNSLRRKENMRKLLARHKIKQLLKSCIGYCSKCKSKNACKRMQEGVKDGRVY